MRPNRCSILTIPMKKLARSLLLLCAISFGAAILLHNQSQSAATRAPWSAAKALHRNPTETFQALKLRGYGTVSGSFWEEPNRSVLEITCESEKKAKLLHAKYLSDLGQLPGVTVDQPTGIHRINGQGAIAAYCKKRTVTLLSAAEASQLKLLAKEIKVPGVTTAQVKVPMYLDRWDKFNFRHYYRVWETPKESDNANYDYLKEFDWAQAQDHAGILLATDPMSTDTAEGMMNTNWWEWTAKEAQKHNLPVELHIGCGAGSDPIWLLNEYRDQTQLKMPGFTGNFHSPMSPSLGGQGVLSWNATTGRDAILGVLQQSVKKFGTAPNVTSFLEPHGELHHSNLDIFLEYGPVADANYQRYLKEQYGTVETVAKRWGRPLQTWGDARVPDLATFAGWEPGALDVGGLWRVGYETLLEESRSPYNYVVNEAPASTPAPAEWFQPGFNDSAWPQVLNGNDLQLFLEKRPAVFRRTFELPRDWQSKHPRSWLYIWDLNTARDSEVRTVLNGKEVGKSVIKHNTPHWEAVEATSALQPGRNTLALRLPQGYISYKVYLSSVEPRQYPNLGEALNAQWVDFIDFMQWSRIQTVKRGMEMIRQVAPAPGIVLMAPDAYADGIKSLAVAYGGEFHNTGYMGGFYADYLPSLMRGANLPYSIEPGGPAKNLPEFKKQLGLYQVEGVQAIDYFIHLGDIFWHPDTKAYYEKIRQQLKLMGQSHYPKAELAFLYSDRTAQLTGFPWGADHNIVLGGGYWNWNGASVMRGRYPYDALSQSSFASGDANAYRVIIDSNTSVMDEAMVEQIEKWVRNGGTFITLAQTGRHTPQKPNSWPISRLTGYKTVQIDPLLPDGQVEQPGTLEAAPDQQIFDPKDWAQVQANGLHLQKEAADAKDLLLWADGTVAAGMRPLGRGYIVELGAKFSGEKIGDRMEPGNATSPDCQRLYTLLASLLKWQQVKPEPGSIREATDTVILRHGVTNNGLYDVWTLWNQSPTDERTVNVDLNTGHKAPFYFDMVERKPTAFDGTALRDIALPPLETRVFLTPRLEIPRATADWFRLQRGWWQGTTQPSSKPLPVPSQHLAMDLTPDWKFQTFDASQDLAPMLQANFPDQAWETRDIGIWNVKEAGGKANGIFRKTFTVPETWKDGTVSIWLTSWNNTSFIDAGKVCLDGRDVKGMNSEGYFAINLADLKPGTQHTLAVQVQSKGTLAGLRGESWLSYEPAPREKIDLKGNWTPSTDGLVYSAPIPLPGSFDTQFLKRTVPIDAKYKNQKIMLTVDGSRELINVLINGKHLRRHHHMIGTRASLDITTWVHFGEENEIILTRWNQSGPGTVTEVFLGIFDPKTN